MATKNNSSNNKPSPVKGKPVKASQVEMNEIVLPGHTNQLGTIFGGQLVAWIDIAASIAAGRHARSVCVTASIDALNFVAPVKIGEVVNIFASVNFTGRTSMEIGVRLESENQRSATRAHVATSYLTFVAVDEKGKPQPVPPVVPETADEKRRFKEAQMRRQARLELKKQING